MENKEFDIAEWDRHHLHPLNESHESHDIIFDAIFKWLDDQRENSTRMETAADVFKDYKNYIKMEIIKAQSND